MLFLALSRYHSSGGGPEAGLCKNWGLKFQDPDVLNYGARGMASNLAGHSVLVAGPLMMEWSALESIGWCAVAYGMTLVFFCYQQGLG